MPRIIFFERLQLMLTNYLTNFDQDFVKSVLENFACKTGDSGLFTFTDFYESNMNIMISL